MVKRKKDKDDDNWWQPMPDEAWDRWKDMNRRFSKNFTNFFREWVEDSRSFAQQYGEDIFGFEQTYSFINAWQPTILAHDTRDHYSGKLLKKGTEAMMGMSETTPPIFVSRQSWKDIMNDKPRNRSDDDEDEDDEDKKEVKNKEE